LDPLTKEDTMELQQEKAHTGASEGRQFIGGEWVDAAGGGTFESLDPFTGDVVANIAAGGREDAARAVEAAHAAFAEWSQSPPAQRQGIFLKAADIVEARQDDIVSLLARESGSTFGFAMFQAHVFVPGLLRQAAALAVRAARRGAPVRHGRVLDGVAAAGRRRRRDRAVERRADPLRPFDRGARSPSATPSS
jgi:acyl-CoA reductase-like NAD-dependent aldehyde dehydrogenase